MPPRASILLATRDRLPYLRLALESARGQTIRDIEIMVSDEGSTDDTPAYVARVAAMDPRVRLITGNPVHGVYENFSYLLDQASSEFVSFLGDDDLLEPTFVEELLAGFDHVGVLVSYAAFDIIDGAGDTRTEATSRARAFYGYDTVQGGVQGDASYVALRGQLWLGACLYRKSIVAELGFDQSRYGPAADWDLALNVAERGEAYFVPSRQWRYRDHRATASRRSLVASRRAAVLVLTSRSYADAALEATRKWRLRRELLSLAAREIVEDPTAARRTLAVYVTAGGTRRSARFVALSVLLHVPDGFRDLAFDLARRASDG